MRYDWFKQFSINQFESVLRFSQISMRIRIRIQFLVIAYYEVMFSMLMMLMKFSFVPQNFFRFFFFRIRIWIRIPLAKSITEVMLCVLKISTKFGVVLQSFFQNQNPVQDEDQDQDHDITLDLNTRPTFHT